MNKYVAARACFSVYIAALTARTVLSMLHWTAAKVHDGGPHKIRIKEAEGSGVEAEAFESVSSPGR